jgi:hypothetical protein
MPMSVTSPSIATSPASIMLCGSNAPSSIKQIRSLDAPLSPGDGEKCHTSYCAQWSELDPIRFLRTKAPAPPPSLFYGTKWRAIIRKAADHRRRQINPSLHAPSA